MTTEKLLEASTKGGPGLEGYAFDADVWCVRCAGAVMRELAPTVAAQLTDLEDPRFRDSAEWPQPIFFGAADTAQHCAHCGAYLYGTEESVDDDERSYGPRRKR